MLLFLLVARKLGVNYCPLEAQSLQSLFLSLALTSDFHLYFSWSLFFLIVQATGSCVFLSVGSYPLGMQWDVLEEHLGCVKYSCGDKSRLKGSQKAHNSEWMSWKPCSQQGCAGRGEELGSRPPAHLSPQQPKERAQGPRSPRDPTARERAAGPNPFYNLRCYLCFFRSYSLMSVQWLLPE